MLFDLVVKSHMIRSSHGVCLLFVSWWVTKGAFCDAQSRVYQEYIKSIQGLSSYFFVYLFAVAYFTLGQKVTNLLVDVHFKTLKNLENLFLETNLILNLLLQIVIFLKLTLHT